MAVLRLYAGASDATSASGMHELPSPISVKPTNEQIWSSNTGRALEGENIAKMIGSSLTGKVTYQIQWGIITPAQYSTIKTYLKRGFFKFGIGTSATDAFNDAIVAYRSEITGEIINRGDTYYKDVAVSVIEQ